MQVRYLCNLDPQSSPSRAGVLSAAPCVHPLSSPSFSYLWCLLPPSHSGRFWVWFSLHVNCTVSSPGQDGVCLMYHGTLLTQNTAWHVVGAR